MFLIVIFFLKKKYFINVMNLNNIINKIVIEKKEIFNEEKILKLL